MADFTKSEGLLQTNEWELLNDTGGTPYWESNPLTLDDDIGAILHIDCCHLDGNAVAAGSEAIIIVWDKSGTGDDDWHELIRFTATGGTAATNALDAESASGQAQIHLTNTTGFEDLGSKYFLNDNDGLANSEIIVLAIVGSAGASGYLIAADNLSHTFAIDDDIISIVDQWEVRIPKEVKTARVTMHNPDGDATYAARVRYSKGTDIE